MPFVSSFTAKPRALIFRRNSGRSRCSVGSPPVTATPSSSPFRWARNEKYFLQAFKDSGDVISGGYAAFTREEMESFRAILLPAIPNAEIRGMD